MIISIWRYSHYLQAVIAGLFIFLASVTGLILAFEPITDASKDYYISASKDYSLGQTLTTLKKTHDEVFSINVDENGFVLANLTSRDGRSGDFYVNPITGEILGQPEPKAQIFEFATNLHRSLFLKTTGRIIVGVVSCFFLLIAISGFVLVTKRQGGIKKWFSKVVYENASNYFHVVLSRLTFVPIIIICVTGVLLSLDRFSILPKGKTEHRTPQNQDYKNNIPIDKFVIFKRYSILDISNLEFPFSPFEEDFFILKTPTEEFYIHQFDGSVISKADVSSISWIIDWSLILHTGQGSILWSVILGFSSIVIMVLMFTGYKMAYDRITKTSTLKNVYGPEEAKHILLVGSETGSTFRFAHRFSEAMIKANQSIYVDAMDNMSWYKSAKYLIIFTATYGEGDAPSNAKHFIKALNRFNSVQGIRYSVVGFGSLAYPNYCQYAIEVNKQLKHHPNFEEYLPLFKINNQSEGAFVDWINLWNARQNYDLKLKPGSQKIKGLQNYRVIAMTELNIDDTFLIKLKPLKRIKFKSGDLLSFYPEEDRVERQYSVAKVGEDILLSIKKHEFGVCSNWLYHQKPGRIVKAKLKHNSDFHLPHSAKEVLMISNGTGIAPFLGMLYEQPMVKKHLFWGGRTKASKLLYEYYLNLAIENQKLTTFKTALSREEDNGRYVQDLVSEHEVLFVNTIKHDGIIMICGSIAMQNLVLQKIEDIILPSIGQTLLELKINGQLKMDCY